MFFGSSSGNTSAVAELIKDKLSDDDAELHDVALISIYEVGLYNKMILGVPTWSGGKLQKDWKLFLEVLKKADLKNKKVALFGLGDQEAYPDNFVDSLGEIYDYFVKRGCRVVGKWPLDGYHFNNSRAVIDNKFVGLVLDEDTQSLETEKRVSLWVEQIKKEFNS